MTTANYICKPRANTQKKPPTLEGSDVTIRTNRKRKQLVEDKPQHK